MAVCVLFRSTDVVYFYRWLKGAFVKSLLPPFLLSPILRCPSFRGNIVYLEEKFCVFIFPTYMHLSLRLKMNGTKILPQLYTFVACTGTTLLVPYFQWKLERTFFIITFPVGLANDYSIRMFLMDLRRNVLNLQIYCVFQKGLQ